MKDRTSLYTVIGLVVLSAALIASCSLLTGCAALGSSPSAPTQFESLLYNTMTNQVTVYHTNQVVVPVPVTKLVTIYTTNQQNQVVTTQSNVVNQVWQTNLVVVPVTTTNYTETVKPSVTANVQAAGSVLNTFVPGAGGLVSTGVAALLGLWGYLRSQKQGTTTTTALAQEIETVREFIQALPNGASYDTALVNFLQAHQAETGIAQSVAGVLETAVSNPDAKVAAQEVINAINALKSTTAPLPNVVAAA